MGSAGSIATKTLHGPEVASGLPPKVEDADPIHALSHLFREVPSDHPFLKSNSSSPTLREADTRCAAFTELSKSGFALRPWKVWGYWWS